VALIHYKGQRCARNKTKFCQANKLLFVQDLLSELAKMVGTKIAMHNSQKLAEENGCWYY
jgi:hypothetical protein